MPDTVILVTDLGVTSVFENASRLAFEMWQQHSAVHGQATVEWLHEKYQDLLYAIDSGSGEWMGLAVKLVRMNEWTRDDA